MLKPRQPASPTEFRIILLLLVIGFVSWQYLTYQPQVLKHSWRVSYDDISIERDWLQIHFSNPKSAEDDHKHILLFEDAIWSNYVSSYEYGRMLAKLNYQVHIIKSPSCPFPMDTYDQIGKVVDLNTPNQQFVLIESAFHAPKVAEFIWENPYKIDALILLGNYHIPDFNLKHQNLPCSKIYAELDGFLNPNESLEKEKYLEKGYELVKIKKAGSDRLVFMAHLPMSPQAILEKINKLTKTKPAIELS